MAYGADVVHGFEAPRCVETRGTRLDRTKSFFNSAYICRILVGVGLG